MAVKLYDPFRRRAGSTTAEFSHYWITYHAEIARQFRRVQRYVQSIRLERQPAGLGPPLGDAWTDGCAETWHANLDSIAAMPGEALFPALMADEVNFLDLDHLRQLITTTEALVDEHGFDERVRGVKVMLFARAAPGVTSSSFADAWNDPSAVDLGRALGARRHVVSTSLGHVERPADQDAAVGDAATVAGYDGVRELWFDSVAALETALEREPSARGQLLHSHLIDVPGSFAMVAHERIIVP